MLTRAYACWSVLGPTRSSANLVPLISSSIWALILYVHSKLYFKCSMKSVRFHCFQQWWPWLNIRRLSWQLPGRMRGRYKYYWHIKVLCETRVFPIPFAFRISHPFLGLDLLYRIIMLSISLASLPLLLAAVVHAAIWPSTRSGCSLSQARLTLPSNQKSLTSPTGAPSFIALGVGVQNYTCNDTSLTYT